MENVKPICGADKADAGEYDLPLHIAAVFLVFAASLFGAGFPVTAKKVKWLKIPPKIFFACKHFGTGVLIATAFVHLLPTAFTSLTDPCLPYIFSKGYPAFPRLTAVAIIKRRGFTRVGAAWTGLDWMAREVEVVLTLLFNLLLLVFLVKLLVAIFSTKLAIILLYLAILLFAMALSGRFPGGEFL